MKRLKPLDAAWLYVESRDTPMHVAGLQILKPPKNAKASFLRDVMERFKESTEFVPPWNLRLADSALSRIAPAWEIERMSTSTTTCATPPCRAPAASASWACWCRACTATHWT